MSVYRCPEFTGQPDLLFWSSGDLFPGAPLVRQVGNLLKSVVLPWLRDITGIELNDTINMFAAQYASTGSNAWSLLQFLNEGIMTTNYISKQFIQNLVVFDDSIVDRVGLVLLREFVRHSAQACGSRSPRPVEAGAQGLWRPEPKACGGRSPRPVEPEPKRFWMIGAGAKKVYIVEPEPEIWVPDSLPYFVRRANCANKTIAFNAPNHFGSESGAKTFRCLMPEPEIWFPTL